jgi:hypothetical protein
MRYRWTDISLVAYNKNAKGAIIWLNSSFNNNINTKEWLIDKVEYIILVNKI